LKDIDGDGDGDDGGGDHGDHGDHIMMVTVTVSGSGTILGFCCW